MFSMATPSAPTTRMPLSSSKPPSRIDLVAVEAADRQLVGLDVDGLLVGAGRDEDQVAGLGGVDRGLDGVVVVGHAQGVVDRRRPRRLRRRCLRRCRRRHRRTRRRTRARSPAAGPAGVGRSSSGPPVGGCAGGVVVAGGGGAIRCGPARSGRWAGAPGLRSPGSAVGDDDGADHARGRGAVDRAVVVVHAGLGERVLDRCRRAGSRRPRRPRRRPRRAGRRARCDRRWSR